MEKIKKTICIIILLTLVLCSLASCGKRDLDFQNQFLRLFNLDFITTMCEESSIIQDDIYYFEINLNEEEKKTINEMIQSVDYFYSSESEEYKEIYRQISKRAYIPKKIPPASDEGYVALYNEGTETIYRKGTTKIGIYFVLVKYTGDKLLVYGNWTR